MTTRNSAKCGPVLQKDLVDAGNLYGQSGRTQTQIDHAGVALPVEVDEFAEVAVGGDKDAPLFAGDRQNLVVWQAGYEILGDALDVVAETG